MTDGFLCGWRVRSDIALPELPPWRGDDRPADIVVVLGDVPAALHDLAHRDDHLQIARDGQMLLTVDRIATFWIRSAGDIVVALHPAARAEEVRLLFFGSVFGALCHLRDLFPLHGSCVAVAGRALVFAGPSGGGKSTIAAHLCARGHGLVADDVTAVELRDGRAMARPAFPRLKLLPDALHSLDPATDDAGTHALVRDKFHVDRRDSFHADALPLAAVVLLERADDGEAEALVRVEKMPTIMARLYGELFRPTVAAALGGPRRLFGLNAGIARSVPVYCWRRRFDFAGMAGWLDRLEALAQP